MRRRLLKNKKSFSMPFWVAPFILIVFPFVSIFILGQVAYGYSKFYNLGESACLSSSGGRQGFMSVQYACSMAVCRTSATPAACRANRGQNGCSGWLGPVGNSSTRTIRLSAPSVNSVLNIQFFGMCTDSSDTTSAVALANDNGSIAPKTFTRPGSWGSPSGPTTTIDVAKFITGSGVTVTTTNGVKTYHRRVGIGRSHSDAGSAGGDVAWIYITIGGEPPSPDPVEADCKTWGSVTPKVTSTLIKVKNGELISRSGGAVGDWTEDKVFARPDDNITWHACYYPGVQTETYKQVSEVTGNYKTWTGYAPRELPKDSCMAADGTVETKELWNAINPYWYNSFGLNIEAKKGGGSEGLNGRASGSFGGDYEKGDSQGKEAENTMGIKPSDVRYDGNIITETSITKSPIKAEITNKTLGSEKVWGGTCHKNSNSVDSAKIDGEHVYPLCPSTGVNYTDTTWPNHGVIPANPAAVPPTQAKDCWSKVTGKAKSCKDCNGDKNCMDNLNCNTCDGNSDCTCNDDFQCLQCVNKYVGADGDGNRVIQTAELTKGPAKDDASVIVPYNYSLDTGVTLNWESPTYAGETVEIRDFWIDINTRYNPNTYDDYATVVPEAKYALVSYVTSASDGGFAGGDEVKGRFDDLCSDVSDRAAGGAKPKQCVKLAEYSGELNPDGHTEGNPHESHLKTDSWQNPGNGYVEKMQNAFDASAGDYLCMVSAIWPTESGDADVSAGGNDMTRFSVPSCVQIAKKPTFQVWGGDMYSRVNIENNFADKRNVYAGYWGGNWKLGDSFKTSGGSVTHFGSWVEEGLMLGGNNGKTGTIASGAALGERDNLKKANTGNEGELCDKMAPLTFSNICTGSGTVESAKIASLTGSRRDLISYWVSSPGNNVSGSRNLGSLWDSAAKQESATDTEIRYLKANGSLTITGGTMSKRRLLLIDKGTADTTVTISGNIKYESPLNSLADIPKLIIYAKDINIMCNVTEIDAILIADGTVNTCSNSGDDHSNPARANRLEIFGTVIADKVILGRTYGAAAWKASGPNGQGEAAEIFNYDSSILMWSESMSGSAQTDTLQTVYQRELAPRY